MMMDDGPGGKFRVVKSCTWDGVLFEDVRRDAVTFKKVTRTRHHQNASQKSQEMLPSKVEINM